MAPEFLKVTTVKRPGKNLFRAPDVFRNFKKDHLLIEP